MATVFFNRATRCDETERILGNHFMRFAYQSPMNGMLRWPLFGTAFCSRLLGMYADMGISRIHIGPIMKKLGIELADFVVPEGGFKCFNDFFARKLQPGARNITPSGLASPADCRLNIYPKLEDDTCISVKGRAFTVSRLLFGKYGFGVPLNQEEREALLDCFKGGSLCVFRLCPTDYHRYHFPDDGKVTWKWSFSGRYHSVHPIAIARNIRVFTKNVRHVSILDLNSFGTAAFIEVGAFGVGSIIDTFDGRNFKRGDEKGYFKFGGSTIIMIFQPGVIKYDEDLLSHSISGVESLIRMGEHVGVSTHDVILRK